VIDAALSYGFFGLTSAHRRAFHTISAEESAVEMRQIAEAGVIGDRADGALCQPGIAQHPVRAPQALVEQKSRECRSFALKQDLHITRRDAMARRKADDRQVVTVQAVEDVRLDRVQARRAQAAVLGALGGVARRAQRERGEIVDVIGRGAAEFGRCQRLRLIEETDVARQEVQRSVPAADRPQNGA
jgi:hypothetical protein